MDQATTKTSPAQQLTDIEALRTEMEQNFHLYEEIKALPPSDADALFRILWEAQGGDPTIIRAIHEIVYEEVPVPMDEFIFARRYLGLKGLINPEKVDLLIQFDQPHVRKMWAACGSGAGKSFMVSIAKAREVYKLLCLRRPDLFYMLGPGSKIACINLSVSKEQARDVIFAEFVGRIRNSPWFTGKYEAQVSRALFPKGIAAISGGTSATSYYGYHTFMGSLDEASFMLDGNRSIAEELVEALLKSLNTRFPRAYKLMVISTLRSADDFLHLQIERLREEGVRVQ